VPRLQLPTVTLCAVSSVNIGATIEALRACLEQIDFAECLFMTDADVRAPPAIQVVPIDRLGSAEAYSEFLLRGLVQHLRTRHCLVIQWDGFVLDAARWEPHFLDFDYVGAPWPQFRDGHAVGNGGFSLRSRRLLEACQDPKFSVGHPEDVAICRTNRPFLEREYGIRFADLATAQRFAFERTPTAHPTFGFHGVFNMIPALGADRFWEIYSGLDDKQSAFVDYRLLMRQLGTGERAAGRRIRLSIDLARGSCKQAVSSR
jgi:Protein of unknown function (DUF5672)